MTGTAAVMVRYPSQVALYRSVPGRLIGGSQPAGRFALDENTDEAVLFVADESSRVDLEEFAAGLASSGLRRTVGPEQGQIFLLTLLGTFRQASRWRAVPKAGAPHL